MGGAANPGFVVLLGPPGSGKGTQAKNLSQKHSEAGDLWLHISTGDLFRKEIASGSTLGQSLESILAQGQLVTDDLTDRVFTSQLQQLLKKSPQCLLLDGYPRTPSQARYLKQLLSGSGKTVNCFLIEFEGSEELVVARLGNRWVNPRSGKIYHAIHSPPQKTGVCDEDGLPLVQRNDDKEETVRKRYHLYEQQKIAILEELKDCKKISIQAQGEASQIARDLDRQIAAELKRLQGASIG